MRKEYIILIVILLLQSCNIQEEKSKKFGFRIETETYIINSFDSTYKRIYLEKDTIIKILFSEKEIQQIIVEFTKNDLDKLPLEFKPFCLVSEFPSFETKFKLELNNKRIEAVYCSSCDNSILDKEVFNQISGIEKSIDFVNKIVESKKDVMELPSSNMEFK